MTDITGGSAIAPGSYRTTNAEVTSLLGISNSIDVTLYIASANSIINKVAICAGSELDSNDLALLERWVSAHFYYGNNPGVTSKSIAGASTSFFRGALGEGIESSPYGQQAVLLDTSGCLLEVTAKVMKLTWLGTESE